MFPLTRRASLLLSPRTWAILALLSANVIWGTTFVATKPMLDRMPPITVATGRFAVALMILLPLLARSGQRPILSRTTALMGFVGMLIVYTCQNVGLSYTGAANAAIIHGGIPVFTVLIAAPMIGERLDRRRLMGIGLSMAGVTAVVLRGTEESIGLSLVGDGLVLLSGLGLAGYLVLGRRVDRETSPLALVGGVTIFGFLYLLPAGAIELGMRGMDRPTIPDLIGLFYLGAAASALAFVLWAYGLRHLEAGQAASFTNLSPLVGVIVAALVLGEAISLVQIAGGMVILLGVWLATRFAPDLANGDTSPATPKKMTREAMPPDPTFQPGRSVAP